MTSRTLTVVLAFFALLTLLVSVSCNSTPSAPPRPPNVPLSAVWVGGRDGGAFLDCTASTDSLYACSVYNDATGDVWASGKFAPEGRESSMIVQASDYSAYDGRRIILRKGLLVPIDAARPSGVPDRAILAENGIWVDCDQKANAGYDCSLFLASNGQKVSAGAYKIEGAEETQVVNIKPKIASRNEIFLVGGVVLRARN